jgi:hypothetical protein
MILWLSGANGYSPVMRAMLGGMLQKAGLPGKTQIIFNSLHYKATKLSEHNPKKMPDLKVRQQALKNLQDDCKILRPNLIVINDQDTLQTITGEKYSLATTRGSLYYFGDIPCLVIDNFNQIRYKKFGKFVFEMDLEKIARWAKGEQYEEPAFSYVLCKTVNDVA